MNPKDEERITRWIDGELDESEIEDLLAAHPDLREAKEAALETGRLLRKELETGDRIPFPDFFNRQVQRHIEDEQALEERKKAYEEIPEADFFSWFTFTRNLAGAALLVLVGVFIGQAFQDSRSGGTEIVYTYVPDPAVTATMDYSADANATVLLLDGLSPIPAAREITGHRTAGYMPNPGGLLPTLYSADDSKTAFVLVKDHNDIPSVREVQVSPPSLRRF
jgi:hypothetical protein